MNPRRPRRLPVPGAFLCWFAALATCFFVRPARAEEPGLSDTVDFVRRSLEEHGDFRNIAGGARMQQRISQVLGRRLRIRRILSDGTPGGAEVRGTTEFSLEELDPEATHVRLWFVGDRLTYAVWLADGGKGGGVREWNAGNEDLGAENRPYGWFAVDSEELAQSLVKAINHAIALAGGKPRPAADRFFGAPVAQRTVPASPITDGVHHVVTLEDSEKLLRRRMQSTPDSFPTLRPSVPGKSGWTPVRWASPPMIVTLPGPGSGFETNYLDAVRFEAAAAGKSGGIATLLEVVPDFIAAGISGLRDGPLPCERIQLPLSAGQLSPLAGQVPEATQVRLWTTIGESWPDGEGGFVWLARTRDGERSWRVAVHPTRRFKSYGPDAAKVSAQELGLQLADPVVDVLKARAKAAKKAARQD